MKIALSFIVILLFLNSSSAQTRKISKDEYDKVFQFAETKTNADYPLIFAVTTNHIENGKTIRTETAINENEAQGRYRIRRTVMADGKQKNIYQITAGFGNVFCSDDGVSWKSSEYECSFSRVMTIYSPRNAESTEYSVTEKKVKGKKISIYREYSVFAASESGEKKDFTETLSTIDSRGFFITVVATEGTLDPRTVTLVRKQSWTTKANIKPVVAPIK